jgi:polyisoprenoid-binding protein YceI
MSRRMKFSLAGAGVVVAMLALAGGAFWYLVLRDDAPPPVSLTSAVQSLTPAATAPGGDAVASTPAAQPAGLAGSWTVVPAQSFVGYRVVEELVRVGANTAVGRTSAVTGTFVIEGGRLVSANAEADLTQLRSDNSLRDGQLRTQGLETNRFPKATFTLTSPADIPEGLGSGQAVSVVVKGDLTLHGVTREIEMAVDAVSTAGRLVAVGSVEIQFADYQIRRPSGASVLSIEDHGVLELQLVFERRG